MEHTRGEVVLVEDDAGMRQAVARMLWGAGYAVKSFESAEALLDALGGSALWGEHACLVCDVRLPGASGFELHRRIAAKGPAPSWIFVTAHDTQLAREQAQRAAAAYLTKPFEGRALLELIASVMTRPQEIARGS